MKENKLIANGIINNEKAQYLAIILTFGFCIKIIELAEKAIDKNYNVKADFKDLKLEIYH